MMKALVLCQGERGRLRKLGEVANIGAHTSIKRIAQLVRAYMRRGEDQLDQVVVLIGGTPSLRASAEGALPTTLFGNAERNGMLVRYGSKERPAIISPRPGKPRFPQGVR
jgi:hypothetical protein